MSNEQNIDTNASSMEHCFENLILIDCGSNLANKKYARDLDQVLKRAKDAGVQKIIVPGNSVKASKEALRLTRIYPGDIYASAGIHPHDSKSIAEEPESWEDFEVIAANPEVVAIGPCGLDYQRDFSDPETQKEVFEKQIKLAISLRKPLLIHERAAQNDVVEILKKYSNNVMQIVIRGFIGTVEEALKYIDLGYYITLNGYLCKDKSDVGVRKLLEDGRLPLDRLIVETDSPFMYPNTRASKLPNHVKAGLTEKSMIFLHRYCTFQRNEPCSLPATVEMIAAFMNKGAEDVALATSFNALKLFGLSQ
ncbi:3'-5' ssDNA/RNA exonuclease TatD [Culicoides brevitarsis]|uniref:3'-5' ssDNA/RNA exonuclease TatD n=1 Tax=Culicoides brevitarsis TaxID=469753 RepID=UPI00307C568C